jgi:ClpP class serine protease
MTTKRVSFRPHGPLALDPRAYGAFFDVPGKDEPAIAVVNGVAIVDVYGPLMHHESWWCASYDAIRHYVEEAIEQSPRAVCLRIDSPGGLVSGLFETCQAIRSMCDAAGIPLLAYVEGQCTSAAYALACAADHITAPASATVGSIGVLDALVDARAGDAMFGVAFTLVASGARKTDGNPHVETSEGAIAATRANVDALAQLFFAHVAAHRGLDVAAIQALEAGVMIGPAALAAGLVDDIGTLDTLLGGFAAGTLPAPATVGGATTEKATMTTTPTPAPAPAAAAPTASKKYEDAIAVLRKLAEGDDDEAKKAKKMLQAELADDPAAADDEEDDDTAPAPSEPPPAPAKESKADAALREARAARAAAERAERDGLIAQLPDGYPQATRDALAKAPVATVRAIVASLPTPTTPRAPRAREAAATATPGSTRGAGQGTPDGERATRQSPEAKSAMDRAMGMEPTRIGVASTPHKLILGARIPEPPKTP